MSSNKAAAFNLKIHHNITTRKNEIPLNKKRIPPSYPVESLVDIFHKNFHPHNQGEEENRFLRKIIQIFHFTIKKNFFPLEKKRKNFSPFISSPSHLECLSENFHRKIFSLFFAQRNERFSV